MELQRVTWKLTVLGQPGSGKSSLVSRIVYDSDSGPVKQRGLMKKKMSLERSGSKLIADLLFLELQDEEGIEKLLTGSNCILVTVDITRGEELEVAEDILKYLNSVVDSPVLALVGTKSDLKYEAAVWEDDFERVKKSTGVDYFLVSAKTAAGTEELLQHVTESLLDVFYSKRK